VIVEYRLDSQLVSARAYVAGEGEGIAGFLTATVEKEVLTWLKQLQMTKLCLFFII